MSMDRECPWRLGCPIQAQGKPREREREMGVAAIASSTVSMHPPRCLFTARLFSSRFSLSPSSSSSAVCVQWPGCVEVARAGDTDMLKRIEAFVDPTEVTKTGKRLPRSYVQSARELVRTLREALKDDVQQELKSRVVSESAKEAIRVYLSSLRSSKELPAEDSFQALTKALRVLGQFYLTAGPRASLPQDVKATILQNLDQADAAL